MLNVVY